MSNVSPALKKCAGQAPVGLHDTPKVRYLLHSVYQSRNRKRSASEVITLKTIHKTTRQMKQTDLRGSFQSKQNKRKSQIQWRSWARCQTPGITSARASPCASAPSSFASSPPLLVLLRLFMKIFLFLRGGNLHRGEFDSCFSPVSLSVLLRYTESLLLSHTAPHPALGTIP